MIVDFVFGGSSFLAHNTDVVDEMGHHEYEFAFRFGEETYRFRRGTQNPNVVLVCDEEYEPLVERSLDEHTAFLKNAYGINLADISFRALIGLYLRVWGKENLDVQRPLHISPKQTATECITNLIKTFGRYGEIKNLMEALATADETRRTLKAAVRHSLVPKVGKRDASENERRIAHLEQELQAIKENLAKYATNLSEIVSREVLELKVRKDELLTRRLTVASRLSRTQKNLDQNRHIRSRHFQSLVEYVPEIDSERLARVEEFHTGIARLLRVELRSAADSLREELASIDEEISTIDMQMASTLSSVDEPTVLVDRVYDVSTALVAARSENEQYRFAESLKESVEGIRTELTLVRERVLEDIQTELNDGISRIVSSVFGAERKSPRLTLRESSYTYEVFDDTGTGTAYSSLIVLDLAVFSATALPIVAHDSLLFKNIENDSVARLLQVYNGFQKQSFIAIDEIQKYGDQAEALLVEKSVIQLDNENVLFIKDWRRHAQDQ